MDTESYVDMSDINNKGMIMDSNDDNINTDTMAFLDYIKLFFYPFDARFEDLTNGSKGSLLMCILRDFGAGLIVAMIAIPLAMGLAIASGLKPVHGIAGGAIAGFMGAVFGGSKYQVYGPTAALIPVIASIMHIYGEPNYDQGIGVMVFCSVVAGVLLMLTGLLGIGKYVSQVPISIVVGFTIGISITIIFSEIGELFGLKGHLDIEFIAKIRQIIEHINEFNPYCFGLGIFTFIAIKLLLKISIFIPAPVLAIGLCTIASETFLQNKDLVLVVDRYGKIPSNILSFTLPKFPEAWFVSFPNFMTVLNIIQSIFAIMIVCAIESLLCSRMADRLADNKGTPFNANKELWGQGMVNIVVPIINGFPHTGALARTATNIKLGAVSPLAGILKGILKLILAYASAKALERIPMACIGGILLYVALNMVSYEEVKMIINSHDIVEIGMMFYTSITVILLDFSKGVVSAIILHFLIRLCIKTPKGEDEYFEKNEPLIDNES